MQPSRFEKKNTVSDYPPSRLYETVTVSRRSCAAM